jgi:glycosyltransferase involved in cell wall biosynthesis
MISILMPIYNGIEFLPESMASVVSQTYTEWELLIGINGHADPTPYLERVSELSKGDPRIRAFGLDTRGKPDSLNALLPYANGEWIAILDVDDIWFPTKLEEQVRILPRLPSSVGVVGTWCVYFGDRSGSPTIPSGHILPSVLGHMNPMINSSTLIRKELCHWTDEYQGLDDYHLWMQIVLHGHTLYNLGNHLVAHRVYSTSAFNSKYQPVEELRKWYAQKTRKTFLM